MTKTLVHPLMSHAPWVGWFVIGINIAVGIALVVFGAPLWIILVDGVVCLLLVALHLWLLVRKPEQRLILSEESLTFIGVWSETTLPFASIAHANFGPRQDCDDRAPYLSLSDAQGRSIEIHPGFIQMPEGVVPFVEERLKAHGKMLKR